MADILFPVGRLVGGSVHKERGATLQDGKTPKLGKDGTQQMSVSFGVAIPKTQAAWQNEPWGQTVFGIGQAAFPQMCASPAFAWKITDGDSALPNKRGKVPNTLTGYAGHWVIWFSQGWAPKLVTADGAAELSGDKFVPGHYVQVFAAVAGNGATGTNTPGVYMNPIAVALAGMGEVIAVDVDTTSVGFGGGVLPAGATPVVAAAPAFAAPAPVQVAPAPVQVAPNASFMAPPVAPAAPVPPAAPAGPVMTAKAAGASYQSFIDGGWTPDAMRANGYML